MKGLDNAIFLQFHDRDGPVRTQLYLWLSPPEVASRPLRDQGVNDVRRMQEQIWFINDETNKLAKKILVP